MDAPPERAATGSPIWPGWAGFPECFGRGLGLAACLVGPLADPAARRRGSGVAEGSRASRGDSRVLCRGWGGRGLRAAAAIWGWGGVWCGSGGWLESGSVCVPCRAILGGVGGAGQPGGGGFPLPQYWGRGLPE